MRPDIRDRIARQDENRRERALAEHERVRRAIDHLAFRNEQEQWERRFAFDLHLLAGDILRRAEEIRDVSVLKDCDEWDDEFCAAVSLIPEAREFVEETAMECTEGRSE